MPVFYHNTQTRKIRWQRIEEVISRILLTIFAGIYALYLHKIAMLFLNSDILVQSLSFSSSIVLFACWKRKRIIDAASYCHGKIRDIEFWVHQDDLPALYPLWGDLMLSKDVSRREILAALTDVSACIETVGDIYCSEATYCRVLARSEVPWSFNPQQYSDVGEKSS